MVTLVDNTRLNIKNITVLILALFNIPTSVISCSMFALSNGRELIVGNNDDWFCDVAHLMVNPSGMTKQNFLSSKGKRLEWTSKYGSVTINFNYLGAASGGMNEAGLVIDEAWPGRCRYPAPDDRPPFDEAQWIQYQLDNCSTVDEVIQTDSILRIVGFFGQSHYFVCDQDGKSACIEWIDGKMVVHILTGDNVPILTNDDYDWSISELRKCKGFGGDQPIGNSPSSLDRFCRAANRVRQFAGKSGLTAVEYGFDILENVSQRSTLFSWIYDIPNRTLRYKTAHGREIKIVPLRRFDLSDKGPMLIADILTTKSGDITGNFEPYTTEKSRDFVTRVVKRWREENFAMHITETDAERMIQYPETMRMAESPQNGHSQPQTKPAEVTGPYFGQTPPGQTPRIFAPGILSLSDRMEARIAFSPDGNECFFTVPQDFKFSNVKMYYTKRVNNVWTTQMPASFLLPGTFCGQPFFSADGNKLYFTSNKNGTNDIWFVDRTSQGWGNPQVFPSPINSTHVAGEYSQTTDGTAYFESDRPGGQGLWDVWRIRPQQPDRPWQTENLGPLVNSSTYDSDPFVSPDGRYLIYSSYRPGGCGAGDLYATLADGNRAWTAPVNMNDYCPGINTVAIEYGPSLSPDGKYLFFVRLDFNAQQCDLNWVENPFYKTTSPGFPVLEGPYLGQPLPGLKAEPFAPRVLSVSGKNHHTLSFSADGKELYFSRYPERVTLVMRQADDIWQPPVSTPVSGWEAIFTPDGQSLIFGDGDLWIVHRTASGWNQAERLKGTINSGSHDYYASVVNDGTLYFSRIENERARILRARPSGDGYDSVEELEAMVNGTEAYHPFVAPDGSYLLFNSRNRTGGHGGADIYVSFSQPGGSFGEPVNLGVGVNSADADLCPVVSPDGKYLFFTRLREGTGVPYWVNAQVIEEARSRAKP